MQQITTDLNNATYVGIDAHPTEHTAVAVNRFEEEKRIPKFANSCDGIQQFLSWLQNIDGIPQNAIIGVEGRGGNGSGFIASMLATYEHVYEVNPQYTKQRRQFGTKGGKSDLRDAKCIADVVIKKLSELPKITRGQLSSRLSTVCSKAARRIKDRCGMSSRKKLYKQVSILLCLRTSCCSDRCTEGGTPIPGIQAKSLALMPRNDPLIPVFEPSNSITPARDKPSKERIKKQSTEIY